jgi:hypothetical protein
MVRAAIRPVFTGKCLVLAVLNTFLQIFIFFYNQNLDKFFMDSSGRKG